MNNTTQSLDALLGIQSDVLEGEVVDLPAVIEPGETAMVVPEGATVEVTQMEDDFQKARKNISEMVKNVQTALDSAIMLAQAGDQPRAYEVVGGMLERLVNANKALVELHQTKKDFTVRPDASGKSLLPQDGTSTVNIDKAVFVGRASDLLREINRIAKEQK